MKKLRLAGFQKDSTCINNIISMKIIPNRNTFFVLLACGFAVIMIMAAGIDYQWTMALHGLERQGFTDLMGRTMFEGDLPSPNDLIIFIYSGFVLLYVLANLARENSSLHPWRPQLGFIVVSGLVTAFGMVHSLKWVIGRVRPNDLLKHDLPYSEWFEFGAYFITEGSPKGSFPSGHTAQAFMLMSVAYVLAGDPRHSRRLKQAGMILGTVVIVFALAMGVSRSMSLHHWISDWLGSIFLSWIIIHALYYWIIKVPEQALVFSARQSGPKPARFRELVLCLVIFVFILGSIMFLTGFRSLFLAATLWLALLIPLGLIGIVVSWKLSRVLVKTPDQTAAD